MLISWAQNYQRKMRYNLTGVVASSGGKEEILVEPATCVTSPFSAYFCTFFKIFGNPQDMVEEKS